MAEVYEFFVAIEGHWVIAQVANVGLSHLYIDDEWHDTYHPDPFNLWGPYNLFEPQPSSQHPGSVPFSVKVVVAFSAWKHLTGVIGAPVNAGNPLRQTADRCRQCGTRVGREAGACCFHREWHRPR
jgi:hypothetical protein